MEIQVGTRCCVVGCTSLVFSGMLCAKHYKRKQRYGDPSINHREKPDGIGKLEEHPLYSVWRGMVRAAKGENVCQRWKDFRNFVKDVPSKPEGVARFRRLDRTKLFGPGNVFWQGNLNTAEYRERAAKAARERHAADPDYDRNSALKKRYGVTLEWYNAKLKEQGGKCAICGQQETMKIRGKLVNMAVDHCHETGKVRGVLCVSCNRGLGLMKHDENLLRQAIAYLRST